MSVRTKAYPRAALIGNPSDGYFGKTIAFVFDNYEVQVKLEESKHLELKHAVRDQDRFGSMEELVRDISLYGYYGGIRLLKGAIKKFDEYVKTNGLSIEQKNFTLHYSSNIPNRLGLAGSSAIITAAIRALCTFYNVNIQRKHLANLVLSVETEELHIPAGLQDRVAQAYNHPVHMDFNREHMEKFHVGHYNAIDIPVDLNLYVAYRTDLAEGSEVLHSRLRHDFNDGKKEVLDAMLEWADLTDHMKHALDNRNYAKIPALLNRNFDLRCEVCAQAISKKNRQMVESARSVGASAKFTGSGGAIIGTYEDEKMFSALRELLAQNQINVIKPNIVRQTEDIYKDNHP